ncbi:MAG: hypothetical protein EA425_06390 [Puniceicoccaceae bacterium]|nr:MAG: hypothetical protein EA425_06390 [Puniceicoccaceae bacterium]
MSIPNRFPFTPTLPKQARLVLIAGMLLGPGGGASLQAQVDLAIDLEERHQEIDGFGTCLAWWLNSPYNQAAWRSMYWSDLGASILRVDVHINVLRGSDNNLATPTLLEEDLDANIAKMNFGAQGVANFGGVAAAAAALAHEPPKIIASVWTPPHWMKGQEVNPFTGAPTNNFPVLSGSDSGGGSIIDTPQNLRQFGLYLASYVKGFEQHFGVPIYALSIQNEPVFRQSYGSCVYSPALYARTLKAVKAVFVEKGLETKFFGPEDLTGGNESDPWILWRHMNFIQAIRGDAEAMAALDIYAVHAYAADGASAARPVDLWRQYLEGRTQQSHPTPAGAWWTGIAGDGKRNWMTESSGEPPTYQGAMALAAAIQDALAIGNVNAFIYWQTSGDASHNQFNLTVGSSTATAKYNAAKHFFRHIRPGAVRVGLEPQQPQGVWGSAYLHEADRTLTVVLINLHGSERTVNLGLGGSPVPSFGIARRTTQGSVWQDIGPVTAAGGSATVTLPALSILTLQGDLSEEAAVLEPPAGLRAGAGPGLVLLAWDEVAGAVGYTVARSLFPDGPFEDHAAMLSSNSFVDMAVEDGRVYFYTVRALGEGGPSEAAEPVHAVVGPSAPDGMEASILRTDREPGVGGAVDPVWSGVEPRPVARLLSGAGAGNSASWKALWSPQGLHLLVEVITPARFFDSANPWDDDSVELYLDLLHSRSSTYGEGHHQLVFRWDDPQVRIGTNSANPGPGIQHVTTATAEGYRLEAYLPWQALRHFPGPGPIGFDLHVNFDNDGGARDAKRSWHAAADNAWSNPSAFASVYLDPSAVESTPPNRGLADWRVRWFGSSAAGGAAAAEAAPAGDGIANFKKYFLDLDPSKVESQRLPRPVLTPQGLELAVDRNPAAIDVRAVGQVSSDLETWHSGEDEVEVMEAAPDRLVWRDLNPAGDDRRFIRFFLEADPGFLPGPGAPGDPLPPLKGPGSLAAAPAAFDAIRLGWTNRDDWHDGFQLQRRRAATPPGGGPTDGVEIIVDNTDSTSVTNNGFLGNQTWLTGAWGGSWHAWPAAQGSSASFTFQPSFAGREGDYDLFIWYVDGLAATNVPVLIRHAGGDTTVVVDMTNNTSQWYPLGTYTMETGSFVRISANFVPVPSGGRAIADAVRLVGRPLPGQDAGPWVDLEPAARGLTTLLDDGLEAETAYEYRLRAFRQAETSPWTNRAKAHTFPDSGPPPVPPQLTVESSVEARVGEPLEFAISATGAPSRFLAGDLPPGLVLNAEQGTITGVPATAGIWTVTIMAVNEGGTGLAELELVVEPPDPDAGPDRMRLGTNFWNFGWGAGRADYFNSGINWATVDNPWRERFLDEISIYSVIRFMDQVPTNSSTLRNWSDRVQKTANHYTTPGGAVAYEWQIDLCNRLGADIWITVPHLTVETYEEDPENNFWTHLAQLLKDQLDPHLNIYVEYSNETWSGGSSFRQGDYAGERGDAMGWGSVNTYTAKFWFHTYAALRLHRVFKDVFADQPHRIKTVLAGQTGSLWGTQQTLVALNDPVVNPWGDMPEYYALANYINTGNGAASNIRTAWTNQLASAAGTYQQVLNTIAPTGMTLISYEGGQHYTTNAHIFSANPESYDMYLEWLDTVAEYFELTMHYTHVGRWASGGSWGAKDSTNQSVSDAHRYRALRDWVQQP